MTVNGLAALMVLVMLLTVHLATRGYYVRQINDLRKINRRLRER